MNERVKMTIVLSMLVLSFCCVSGAFAAYEDSWKLGMQAYSFNRFTFFEAVDKTAALGMHYIEAYPGQRLSKEKPDVKTDHNMSSGDRKLMLKKLRESGVKLMNYGVVGLSNNEAACRKVFDFAKDMGIETIVSEPPEDAFGVISKLCDEYKINVALHNHPKPSHYWDPDTVLRICKGLSPRIGACADTGHWMRSGVNPLEAIKKLGKADRIRSLHFKDLNEFGVRGAHDVIWGTGKADVKAILTELKRQKFEGVFSIEYEHNWMNSMPEISGCVSYFNRIAAELGVDGAKLVFNGKDLSEWVVKGDEKKSKWAVGVASMSSENPKLLVCKAGGDAMVNLAGKHGDSLDIYSKAKFGDCRIELEVMVPKGSNSGIYVMGEYEIQVLDSWGRTKLGGGDMGAVYGASPPRVNASKEPGQWQKYVIDFKAPTFNASGRKKDNAVLLRVELNGVEIHKNVELAKQTSGGVSGKESPTGGPLMFQGNHGPVAYRNIIIKPLGK